MMKSLNGFLYAAYHGELVSRLLCGDTVTQSETFDASSSGNPTLNWSLSTLHTW